MRNLKVININICISLCISLLLLNSEFSYCQTPFIQHYPIDIYRGATQSWDFDQDTQGVIYVANNDGVLSYDGVDWDLITLPNKDFVYSLDIDTDNKIYLGSYNEIGYLLKDSLGKFQYHSLMPKVPAQYQKVIKDVLIVRRFENTVFFVGSEHVFLYSNNNFKILNVKARGLLELWGRLYLIRNNAFYEYKNESFEPAGFNKDLEGITIKFITEYTENTCLILDDKNRLWKFTFHKSSDNKLSLLPGKFTEYFKGSAILKIYCLDNGNIVLVSKNKMANFNRSGELLNTVTSETFGNDFLFSFFYEDMQHNLWISTNSLISQVVTSSPLSYYDRSHGIKGTIISFGKMHPYQYVGTTEGVFYEENKTKFTLLPESRGEVWNFYNFHQKLYVAHGTGVLTLDGKRVNRIISHDYVHSLCEIKNQPDRLIMGTYNTGIWLLEQAESGWHKKKIKGFEEETRFIQQDDDGNIWISHYNKGVFKLQLNEQMDSVTHATLYNGDHGLPSHLNNRIYRLNTGKIIVTTVNGIYSYNYKENLFEPEKRYNDALGEEFCIYSLAETPGGDIYFWGSKPEGPESAGVLIKKPNGDFELSIVPFNKISIPIRDLRIDVDAPLLAANGHEIWIGSNQTVISYNPTQKVFYNDPVHLYIKNVWVEDSLLFRNGMKPSVHKLSSSDNNLKFEFGSTFYENSEKNAFQYKLKGFQDNWSNWSTSYEAVFTNLPQGDYIFQVRTRNLYGNVSQPASFSFHIAPPWYKTWWAILLQVTILILILYTFDVLKNKRIEKRNLLLEQKVHDKTIELKYKNEELLEKNLEIGQQATELKALNSTKDKLFSIISHDLRSPIRQIGEILNLIEKDHVSTEELKVLVPGLNENVRYTIDLMDNLLYWAKNQLKGVQVKPTRFDLKDLVKNSYLALKPLADLKKIHLVNDVHIESHVFADIDMVKLVLRNLIQNAIKFTDIGGKVFIGLRIQEKEVSVFVEDTGIGISDDEISKIFNKEHFTKYGTSGEKGTGLGLMLCKEFIEKNEGSITIESILGKGSKFSFSLPRPVKAG